MRGMVQQGLVANGQAAAGGQYPALVQYLQTLHAGQAAQVAQLS